MLRKDNWCEVGIVFREVIKQNGYNEDGLGKGSYLLDASDNKYFHHSNNTHGKAFKFQVNDIIIIEVSVEHKYIKWSKQNSQDYLIYIRSQKLIYLKICIHVCIFMIRKRESKIYHDKQELNYIFIFNIFYNPWYEQYKIRCQVIWFFFKKYQNKINKLKVEGEKYRLDYERLSNDQMNIQRLSEQKKSLNNWIQQENLLLKKQKQKIEQFNQSKIYQIKQANVNLDKMKSFQLRIAQLVHENQTLNTEILEKIKKIDTTTNFQGSDKLSLLLLQLINNMIISIAIVKQSNLIFLREFKIHNPKFLIISEKISKLRRYQKVLNKQQCHQQINEQQIYNEIIRNHILRIHLINALI